MEDEILVRKKKINWGLLWKATGRKIGQIVVVGITLFLIYYLFAVWGIILLVMSVLAKAGAILKGEAEERK